MKVYQCIRVTFFNKLEETLNNKSNDGWELIKLFEETKDGYYCCVFSKVIE